jgi:hypothetical protein
MGDGLVGKLQRATGTLGPHGKKVSTRVQWHPGLWVQRRYTLRVRICAIQTIKPRLEAAVPIAPALTGLSRLFLALLLVFVSTETVSKPATAHG